MKNLLVVAAPLASGALVHGRTALLTAAAVLAFAMAEAGADILHAAIGDRRAWATGIAVAVPAFLVGTRFGDLVGGYLLFRLAVSLRLGRVAGLATLATPCGVLLRIVAGGAATGAYLPASLLLASVSGALCLVPAGPRRPPAFVAVWRMQMQTLALAGVVLAYASWAFEHRGRDVAVPLLIGSLIPLVAALIRYGDRLGRRPSGGPDWWLALCVLAWAGVSAGAIYLS